jgi:hypothetical protein
MSFNGAKVIKTSYFMVWTVSGPFSELGKRINACNFNVAVIHFPENIHRIYICTYITWDVMKESVPLSCF